MALLCLEDLLAVAITRSAGMLLLSIWLILTGLAGLIAVPLPGVLMSAVALIAGVLILVGALKRGRDSLARTTLLSVAMPDVRAGQCARVRQLRG